MTREGEARHVWNERGPQFGVEKIRLRELWRLKEDIGPGTPFTRVTQARSDADGRVYLLEPSVGLHIYSTGGEYLQTLEHAAPYSLEDLPVIAFVLLSNGTAGGLQLGSTEIHFQDLQEVKRVGPTYRVKNCTGDNVHLFDGQFRGNRLVVAGLLDVHVPRDRGTFLTRTLVLSRVFPKGKTGMSGYEGPRYLESNTQYAFGQPGRLFASTHIDERQEYFPAPDRWALGGDGRVYIAASRDEYSIHVYTPDGPLTRVIHRTFECPQRTPAQLAVLTDLWDQAVATDACEDYTLCDTDPVITRIRAEEDSTLWVLPAGGLSQDSEGVTQTYDIFDSDGHLIRQASIHCPGAGLDDALFFLAGDRIIRITGALRPLLVVPAGVNRHHFRSASAPSEVVCYEVAR